MKPPRRNRQPARKSITSIRREHNNYWYRKYNYGTGLIKTGFSTNFRSSGIVNVGTTCCRSGENLLVPST
jgi:hypothetical protein